MYCSQNEQQRIDIAKFVVPPGAQKNKDNNEAKDNDEVNYENTGFGDNYYDENGNNNCDNNNNKKSQTNSFTRSRSRSLFTSLSILRVTQQDDNTQGFQNNGLI